MVHRDYKIKERRKELIKERQKDKVDFEKLMAEFKQRQHERDKKMDELKKEQEDVMTELFKYNLPGVD
jgi:hypothetical protein